MIIYTVCYYHVRSRRWIWETWSLRYVARSAEQTSALFVAQNGASPLYHVETYSVRNFRLERVP